MKSGPPAAGALRIPALHHEAEDVGALLNVCLSVMRYLKMLPGAATVLVKLLLPGWLTDPDPGVRSTPSW